MQNAQQISELGLLLLFILYTFYSLRYPQILLASKTDVINSVCGYLRPVYEYGGCNSELK